MVSVIHSINAAFGVSKAFIPYRPNYAELATHMPVVKSISTLIGTDYTLINDLTYIAPINANSLYRISVRLGFSNSVPRGIIISKSNNVEDYTSVSNLIGIAETSEEVGYLSLIALGLRNINDPIYIWAKCATAKTNNIRVAYEYLG